MNHFGIRNIRLRTVVTAVALFTGVMFLTAPAISASAAVTTPSVTSVAPPGQPLGATPLTSSGCSGDACIYLTNPSSGYLYIEVWAYDSSFYGHFQITGAYNFNTPQQEYYAGGANNSWWAVELPSQDGNVCATAWEGSGGNETNLGTACEYNGG